MSIQTSVSNNITGGIEGMIAEGYSKKTRNYSNSVPQIDVFTVTAANLATTATINSVGYTYDSKTITVTAADLETAPTVNGVLYTVNTGGGTLSKTLISTALVAAINAGETLCTATLVGETCVVVSNNTVITVVGTTNCSVAQTAVSTTTIATGLAAIINAHETTLTAEASVATITLEANTAGTGFTHAATTNCSVVERAKNAATVPFGRLMSVDPDYPYRAHLPVVAADVTALSAVAGITIRNNTVENDDTEGFALNEEMELLTQGVMWVVAEAAVAVNDSVYVRHIITGTEVLGVFRGTADASDCSILPGARFLDTAAAGELTRIEINIP